MLQGNVVTYEGKKKGQNNRKHEAKITKQI